MKMVIAVLRPNRLERVKSALEEAGIRGLTVSEVRGCGRQRGHKEIFRGKEYFIDLVPKNRLEIAVADEHVEKVIEAICRPARTGEVGDGKIFVVPMENAYRVRTGETGIGAI